MVPDAPSLTVVVMCRNYAQYLRTCVESVFAADQPVQLIFVDNGSRDNSVEVARELMQSAPSHVTASVHALSPERTLPKALNFAHEHATGDFIKLISADDALGPNFFRTFRQLVATSAPDVGAWLAGSVVIDAKGEVLRQYYAPSLFGEPTDGAPKQLVERHIVDNKTAPRYTAVSLFYRRKLYDDVGGYDERFLFEDRPFFFEVLKRGWTVLVYPFNNSYYRLHGSASSSNNYFMSNARLPILFDHALRAEWRNKPVALYHLARNVRVVARYRWRKWRGQPLGD